MDATQELLTIKESAKILNVSEMSLRRWTNDGKLACSRVGAQRSRRFKRQDLINFLERKDATNVTKASDVKEKSTHPKTNIYIEGMAIDYGSHLCSFYENTIGQLKLSVPLLSDGLRKGDVCFLVATPEVIEVILNELRKAGCDIGSAIKNGQLRITEGMETKEKMLNYLQTQFSEVTRSGSISMRLVGDMSWTYRKGWETDEIFAYEEVFNNTLGHQYPIVSLCQYDVEEFSGLGVLGALRCHEDTFNYPLSRFLGVIEHKFHSH